MRECENFKCKKDISFMRKNAKYCCRKCKDTNGHRIRRKRIKEIENKKRMDEIIDECSIFEIMMMTLRSLEKQKQKPQK